MSAIFHQVTHSYENNFSVRAKTVFTCGGGVRLPESVCKNLVSLCGWRTRSRKIRFSRADASVAHTRKKKSKKQNKIAKKIETLVAAAARLAVAVARRHCRCCAGEGGREVSPRGERGDGHHPPPLRPPPRRWRDAATGRARGRPSSASAPATSSSLSVERRRRWDGRRPPPLGRPASASAPATSSSSSAAAGAVEASLFPPSPATKPPACRRVSA